MSQSPSEPPRAAPDLPFHARQSSLATALLAVLVCVAGVRLLTLGAYPLFDDTEARYALIGQVMLQSGNWITPQLAVGEPFWAKPPLSVWGTALSLAVFGMNEFAARLPSFLFVAATGWLVFLLGRDARGRRRDGHKAGLLAAAVFASTGLTFYLAGGVMTDPPLLFGIALTMAAYWRCMNTASHLEDARPDAKPASTFAGRALWGYLFFVGVAVSALAKGPIGIVLPSIAIFLWMLWQRRWRETWENLPWISGTLLALVLVIPWYVAAEVWSPGFLRYFIIGEHFERFTSMGWSGDLYGRPRRHPHGTIWVLGFAAMLPWSVLVLAAPFVRSLRAIVFSKEMIRDPRLSYLLIWHLTPFLFFTVPRGVLITYVAMSLPAFALLVAHVLTRLGAGRSGRPALALAAIVPVAVAGLVISLRFDAVAARLPSEAAIVEAFEAQRPSPEAQLVYVERLPFSARFYSEGRLGPAVAPDAIASLLKGPAGMHLAMRRNVYEGLSPDLRARLTPVAAHGRTVLLRTTGSDASR